MPHTPVLLHEVIEYLKLEPIKSVDSAPGKKIIDATLDGGGHTREIISRFPNVKVLGIEFDPVEVEEFRMDNSALLEKMILVNDSYINMEQIAKENDFYPDGVIFDLGVSSWHYGSSGRGFSFQNEEPLDMRFNPKKEQTTAADIVNAWDEGQLVRILAEYGEEQFAESIANAMIRARQEKLILTTADLVSVVKSAVPGWYIHRKIHCATKTFQALRVAVNDEIETIRKGIEAAIKILNPGGRLVVISFHGLEDKTVRTVFKEQVVVGTIKWVTKDTIKPTWAEVEKNKRARSAKMKIIEKL
ncbi:MAG: 16S rRNA (cytosine(1402)-N(4))-methyltransferase RsmH [Patescibacteria group bacterium]